MRKILVIEDNKEIRENLEEYLLEEYLTISDFIVCTAVNGLEGVNAVYEHEPDFIICDISMPIKNGYEVFQEIETHIRTQQIPFIFLTASAQEKDLAQGKASGADAYVIKPYDSAMLLQLIQSLLNDVNKSGAS